MSPGDSESELRHRLDRLEVELEQARAAADAAQREVRAITRERNVRSQELRRERAQRRQIEMRFERLLAGNGGRVREASPDHELHLVLEELRVLAEELESANEELIRTNRDLDERIAERTTALNQANAALRRINAELARRVRAEAEARETAQAQLFQAQKLEAIGQLTGGIAHDFNNLLTVITSGLQLLSRTNDETHHARLIRRIEQAAWRGADVTRRLLAFARRQPLYPQPLAVARHIEGLRELLRHGLRADISIRTAVPPDIWTVEADLAALELALLNLAVNARDAMPNGGTIVLGARNVTAASAVPEQLGLSGSDYVEVFVRDTGMGMSEEVLARVFEPFFTTKEAGKGTGLGLAQVYGFARQSGGTARVESRLGEGTTVSILLRRSLDEPAAAASERSAPRAATSRRVENLTILVVEDDDTVAATVLDMLGQLGHRGVRASSLAAAIAALSGCEPVDLVFTDVLLSGGGSGLDLAREMAGRQLNLPIVLTSGYGAGVTGRLAAANLPFLRKPYTLAALQQALEQALPPAPEVAH
jgi:signal transduction histidine kinase/ActR/RegA family two-component response regulator